MAWVLLFVVIILIIFVPQFWTQHILTKYSQERSDFPGTGGEFAQHLIRQQATPAKRLCAYLSKI